MPSISMSVPHALGQDEAVRRLKERFQSIGSLYKDQVQGLQETWTDNVLSYRFTTFGATISGTVTAEPNAVQVRTDLPLMASMFKGTIEQRLRDELTKALA